MRKIKDGGAPYMGAPPMPVLLGSPEAKTWTSESRVSESRAPTRELDRVIRHVIVTEK